MPSPGFNMVVLFDGGGRMPGISVSKRSMSFGSVPVGHITDSMSFVVSGFDLTDDIVISVGDGFIINQDDSTNNEEPIVLTQVAGVVNPTTIYVRFNPQNELPYTESVDIMSTGASTKIIRLTGVATTPSVYASTFLITGLNYQGSQGPSAQSATFSIHAENVSPLAGDVTVTPSSGIEVYDGSTWQASAFNIPYVGGNLTTLSIYRVRLKDGLAPDDYNFESVTLTGGGTPPFELVCRGSVAEPTVDISETSLAFPDTEVDDYSPSQSFTVECVALYGNLLITAPPGFILNEDDSDNDDGPITLIADGSGDIALTTIYCKLHPSAGQAYSGNIEFTSLNLITRLIAVSGLGIETFISATGGIIGTDGDYRYHIFNSSDNFIVTQVGPSPRNEVEYLIIGGGGGGGNWGGGGGAGGYRTATGMVVTVNTFPVVVGAGGAGGTLYTISGSDGSNSSFNGVTALGGGGGASVLSPNGRNGGSGGGSMRAGTKGTGTVGQGNNGGQRADSNTDCGSGGGGAGAVGVDGITNKAGNGGVGLQSSITGTPTFRAGGGGGSTNNGAGTEGTGGNGGGGNGTGIVSQPGFPGTSNTGGGGGAGSATTGVGIGGAGGSGVVIVRYRYQ